MLVAKKYRLSLAGRGGGIFEIEKLNGRSERI